ncbi:MAG: Zn-dependent exopeptidase M28, partial [Salinivirgaceae bacterium]|nr:Zn-dependent exopeptidase M28 [Salinivirgaceae bacterium]
VAEINKKNWQGFIGITGRVSSEYQLASFPLENSSFFSLFFKNPKLILVVSSNDYQRISNEQERDLSCKIIGGIKKHHSQNVVGLITSPYKTEDEIIISAHYDSYPSSVGADDNASGVGAIIELSKYFLQQKNNLTTNIKFVAFGGEEKGALGSRAYVNAHKDDIANCKLLFNMDQIGAENIFVGTTGGVHGIPDTIGKNQFPEYMINRSFEGIESNWRILAPEAISILSISNKPLWLDGIIRESAEELFSSVKFIGNTGSDEMSFAQAGIVCTAIGTSGNKVHSPLDIPAQINKQSLEDCGKIVAKVVLKTMSHLEMK